MTLILSCNHRNTGIKPLKQNISESVYASGSIVSVNQYQVYANAIGILDQLLVKEGDTVTKGSPLFVIFNEASKINKENAELSAEYAQYNNNLSKLEDLRSGLNFAAQKLKQDSLNYYRQLALWKSNIGSKLQLEQSELLYNNSKANLISSQYKFEELKRQLKFNEKQSLKSLQLSKKLQNDYTVLSEFNGRIYDILKKKGEMVNTQSPIAVIGDAKDFIIELQVDEYDIVRIKNEMRVFVTMDSYKGQVFEARVTRINPIMNQRSKTFKVEAVFTKGPEVLYPNLTVQASIEILTKANALTLPRQYLINDSFVLTTKGDTLKVQTGLMDFNKVEIIKGIDENTEIRLPE
ncbi:MAG TPA: efflux RND transporter periplasmic adaptor subunit [Bacteroidia bacterium]